MATGKYNFPVTWQLIEIGVVGWHLEVHSGGHVMHIHGWHIMTKRTIYGPWVDSGTASSRIRMV